MSPEQQKVNQIEKIKQDFDITCEEIGVVFSGTFFIYNTTQTITNPSFQYDTFSRSLLLEAKDDIRIPYWRSVDNKNISLNNLQKNSLYDLLKVTYYTKFSESRQAIDAL